jgi:hypothetical protein
MNVLLAVAVGRIGSLSECGQPKRYGVDATL